MSERMRILIVDDDHRMAKTLTDIFKVKGCEAEDAYSGPEALEKVAEGHFDCVVTDIKMPEVNGVELYRAIKAMRPDLPVVLMTAYSTDKLVDEGLEEGAVGALTKPLDINLLLCLFSSLRKERSIVIVDDDPGFCKTLGDLLERQGFVVAQVTDVGGLEEVLRPDGQVVLLDMKLGATTGLEVLEEIREQYADLPVILVTGYGEEMASAIECALKISAFTCLYKPFEIQALLEVLGEIRQRELRKLLRQT